MPAIGYNNRCLSYMKPSLVYRKQSSKYGMVNLRFICASYRSLYLKSSLSLLRLSDVLLLVTVTIIPTCVQLEFSYLLQSYKTHIFQNASIFSSKLGLHIVQGLNLTHESHLVLCKIRFLISPFNWMASCLFNLVCPMHQVLSR